MDLGPANSASRTGCRFGPQEPGLRLEDSSARGLAAWARPLRGQVPGGQPVPVAADQELTALVAAGAIGLGIVDVTHVGVPHAVAQGDLPGPAQRRWRRRRTVEHPVIGVKRREMERNVRPELLDHPLRQLVELGVRVVLAGNQQRRQLEPDRGLVLEVLEGLEHRRERARADLAVESLGEGFEVDVGGVHEPVELGPRFGTNLAGGDGHRLDPLFAARPRHVDRVFVEDHRVVVRERNAPAAKLPGGRGDGLRDWPRRPGCPARAIWRCPSSGRTCSRGCSPPCRTRGPECLARNGRAASSRSGRRRNRSTGRRS